MKVPLVVGLLLIAPTGVHGQPAEGSVPQVVPSVDLERYSGTWYEIARLPNRFQNDCAGDVTATYTLLEDGQVSVLNRCRNDDGGFTEVEGRARKQTEEGPDAKLEVRFAPAFLSFLPFVWGEYWIIDLASDYSYSVIGGGSRKYLWILARSSRLPDSTYQGILTRLGQQGYDPLRLVLTPQSGGN
jgi:apolipoprotein D and lipocalin family protein